MTRRYSDSDSSPSSRSAVSPFLQSPAQGRRNPSQYSRPAVVCVAPVPRNSELVYPFGKPCHKPRLNVEHVIKLDHCNDDS